MQLTHDSDCHWRLGHDCTCEKSDPRDAEIARLTAALTEAEARSAALVAGAYEAAAEVAAHEADFVPVKPNDFRKAIRALTDDDATAALARLIEEAKAEGMREAAGIARACIYYDSAGIGFEEEKFEEAILAAAAAKEAKP